MFTGMGANAGGPVVIHGTNVSTGFGQGAMIGSTGKF
jgi:hypothetical protein